MLKLLRKYDRKILAFTTIFLMVSFLATTRYNPMNGPKTGLQVGKINGTIPVLDTEVDRAGQTWKFLSNTMVREVPDEATGAPRYVQAFTATTPVYGEFSNDPKLFCLLTIEARQMGFSVNPQQVREMLAKQPIHLPDGRVVPYEQITDQDYLDQLHDAVGQFVMINQARVRAASVNKISQPLLDYVLSRAHQSLQVRYVAFDAAKYVDKLPTPTPDQLDKQFQQYADVEKGNTSESNPFGIGYKIPEQYQFQTISIPISELKAAVRKTKSEYDWQVATRMYYNAHKDEFQDYGDLSSTKPSTPTTKPYEAAKDDVWDKLTSSDVTSLGETAQKLIETTLEKDWADYHHAHPTTASTSQPTSAPMISSAVVSSAPVSSVGVPYDSYDYLKALAAKVQAELNILPTTENRNELVSTAQLGKLPKIGSSHTAGEVSFASALSQKDVSLFEPSSPLNDFEHSIYFARLTDRVAAHRPSDVKEVLPAVTEDWKKLQSYDLAKKAASSLLETAKSSDLTKAGGSDVTTSGFFGGTADPSKDSSPATVRTSTDKLMEAAAKHEKPLTLAEDQANSKVYVTELAAVRPDWKDNQRDTAEAQTLSELYGDLASQVESGWFDKANVVSRLKYKDTEKKPS